MQATPTTSMLHFVLQRLIGPLSDKELRVASRRRRSYTLRFAYVLSLSVFIVVVWTAAVELAGGGAMSRARMQVAARMITTGIVWFQFCAAQLVALVLMSTTISDEVHGRTLGVLLTTPLRGMQVVLNKFCSRMVQILLLVATTLEGYAGGLRWPDHYLEGPDVTIWMLFSMVACTCWYRSCSSGGQWVRLGGTFYDIRNEGK